jgi:hypothetical protein
MRNSHYFALLLPLALGGCFLPDLMPGQSRPAVVKEPEQPTVEFLRWEPRVENGARSDLAFFRVKNPTSFSFWYSPGCGYRVQTGGHWGTYFPLLCGNGAYISELKPGEVVVIPVSGEMQHREFKGVFSFATAPDGRGSVVESWSDLVPRPPDLPQE